jgi:hypothetical protein
VRAIEVHGPGVHGAVPSANASRAETNVTDAALNPAGTGPPDGCVLPIGTPSAGAPDAGWDTGGGEAAERAGDPAADGARAGPHPAASAMIISPPHAAANDFCTELTS